MTYGNLKVRETPTIKLNTEKNSKKMDLYPCDFECISEIYECVDHIAKEIQQKEIELINTMLTKCGLTMGYLFDNREKFLCIPHGNAKSLFYCNRLMFTIVTEMKNEENSDHSIHLEYTIYVIEDNSESIRELLQ